MELSLGLNVVSLVGVGSIIMILIAIAFSRFYKKVPEQGKVIVVNKKNSIDVYDTGGFVFPIIHKSELMDITRKKISVIRKGEKNGDSDESEGLPCKDNIRVDIKVDFYIGVNPEPKELMKVVKNFSVAKAANQAHLKEYFTPKFSEALKTVAKRFDFEALYMSRLEFREAVKDVIGDDLDGFVLVDVVIDRLEQSSLDSHSTDNIMDVDGIKKITEITAVRHIETNEIEQDEATKIKKKNVEAEAARLQLTKQEEEAIAKQDREVRVIQAEQEALAKETEEQNRLRKESAKIKTDEQVGIETENQSREIRIAQINNERVTEIEQEKVKRARETEAVLTETDVAVKNMQKEKVVEEQRKEVAEITSQRVQIERKTAKEEEETANLRTKEQANREKLVLVTKAEATAEAGQIEEIKKAEAGKKSAEYNAETVQITASAKLLEDEKVSLGKQKLAEGNRAEAAAQGLAEVEVETAKADAIQATGQAEAQAKTEMATAVRATGEAEAKNREDMEVAKAAGARAQYEAMASIDEETREHEKFKLELEKEKEVELAEIAIKSEISKNHSDIMGSALENSNIDIIGGETEIFNKITESYGAGKAIDKKFDGSEVLNALVKDYRSGKKDLPADLKELLQKSEVSTGDIGTMTVANLLSNPKALDLITGFLGKK
jgi:uncharacterized membrane protein YqiK